MKARTGNYQNQSSLYVIDADHQFFNTKTTLSTSCEEQMAHTNGISQDLMDDKYICSIINNKFIKSDARKDCTDDFNSPLKFDKKNSHGYSSARKLAEEN